MDSELTCAKVVEERVMADLDLKEFLPAHLAHMAHSKLFSSLESAVQLFYANKIVDAKFLSVLVAITATEFEKSFDRSTVSSKVVEIAESAQIANYRFDRGYWEIVVPQTTVVVSDKTSGRTLLFKDGVDVSIEGAGGSLRKGKRRTESIKRAHTRQVAKDARRKHSDSSEDDGESDGAESEDGAWKPGM